MPRNYNVAEIILDYAILLPFVAWAEFGFAVFTANASIDSLENPFKKYLYSNISETSAADISYYIKSTANIIGYVDAAVTILAILDIKARRKAFSEDMVAGLQKLKIQKKNIPPFLFNFCLFSISFITNSFSPWVGLKKSSYSDDFIKIGGPTMFVGLMISFALLYAKYCFSSAENFKKIYDLTRAEKLEIINNLFKNKKGILISLRSMANIITRAIRFYNMAILNHDYIFSDLQIKYPSAYISSISVAYRIISTQSLEDYNAAFVTTKKDNQIVKHDQSSKLTEYLRIPSGFIFFALLSSIFILGTLSTPSLFTGPIDNPQDDFTVKDLILTGFGLLFGALATYQYCHFIWGAGKTAYINITGNISSFFNKKQPNFTNATLPLLDADDEPIPINRP